MRGSDLCIVRDVSGAGAVADLVGVDVTLSLASSRLIGSAVDEVVRAAKVLVVLDGDDLGAEHGALRQALQAWASRRRAGPFAYSLVGADAAGRLRDLAAKRWLMPGRSGPSRRPATSAAALLADLPALLASSSCSGGGEQAGACMLARVVQSQEGRSTSQLLIVTVPAVVSALFVDAGLARRAAIVDWLTGTSPLHDLLGDERADLADHYSLCPILAAPAAARRSATTCTELGCSAGAELGRMAIMLSSYKALCETKERVIEHIEAQAHRTMLTSTPADQDVAGAAALKAPMSSTWSCISLRELPGALGDASASYRATMRPAEGTIRRRLDPSCSMSSLSSFDDPWLITKPSDDGSTWLDSCGERSIDGDNDDDDLLRAIDEAQAQITDSSAEDDDDLSATYPSSAAALTSADLSPPSSANVSSAALASPPSTCCSAREVATAVADRPIVDARFEAACMAMTEAVRRLEQRAEQVEAMFSRLHSTIAGDSSARCRRTLELQSSRPGSRDAAGQTCWPGASREMHTQTGSVVVVARGETATQTPQQDVGEQRVTIQIADQLRPVRRGRVRHLLRKVFGWPSSWWRASQPASAS